MLALIFVIGISLVGSGQDSRAADGGTQPGSPTLSRSNPPAEHWVPLFNGRNLDGWYTFLQKHGKNSDPDRVITIEDGAIHLYKDAAEGGQVVMGYIATDKDYGDYHLRLQYRWGTKKFQPRYQLKRDAGLYYHIIGADAVWPRSLQFQIQQTDVGDLIALYGVTVDTWIDPKTRSAAEPTYQDLKQGGESRVLGGRGIAYQKRLAGPFEVDGWNTIEVIARGDTTVHILNGQVVNEGRNIRLIDPEKPGPPRPITRGKIALEIEAAEIYFRNVELRNLSATRATTPDRVPDPKLISEENKKTGATDWQLTRVRADKDGFRSSWIEGYCSKQSVRAGEVIDIMVSTDPPRRFQIEIFRMGFYGGRGARLMKVLGPFDGKARPVPAPGPKNLHECRWEPASRLSIPPDWPSGVYLGRLTTLLDGDTEPYWQSYVIFIVRDERPADILFQCSDNTWQAYNRWPSRFSVYTHPKGGQGPWADVSFDRPYGREAQHEGVRRRSTHIRLRRVPAVRVSAGVLARTARLRRHLLLEQRHAHARKRLALQGVHQRRS